MPRFRLALAGNDRNHNETRQLKEFGLVLKNPDNTHDGERTLPVFRLGAVAEPLVERALAIDEKALGPEHPAVAMDLSNLAVVYNADRLKGVNRHLKSRRSY